MDLIVLVAFPIAWWGTGSRLVKWLGARDRVAGITILACVLGAGTHSLLMTLALLLGLPPFATTCFYLSLGALGAWSQRAELTRVLRLARQIWRSSGFLDRGLVLLVAGSLALLVASAFAPPSGHDALCYHLTEVRHYVENATLEPLPDLNHTFYPKAIEALFVSARAIGTFAGTQVVHALLGVLLVLSVARIGLLLGSARFALLSVLAFLAIRDVTYVFGTADVDLGYALFQVLAITQAVEAIRSGRLRDSAVAGALGGLGVASKLIGGGLVAVVAGAVLIGRIRKGHWVRAVAAAALCGILSLVVYLPWFYRNDTYLEEALFPLRSAKLGLASSAADLDAARDNVDRRLDKVGARYHVLRTDPASGLVVLTFGPPPDKNPLNPVFLSFLPIGLLWLVAGGRRGSWLLPTTMLALLGYAFWFLIYPDVRYGLGPFAILSVAATAGLVFLVRGRRLVAGTAGLLFAVMVTVGLAKGIADASVSARAAFGAPPAEQYLATRVASYRFQRRVAAGATGRILCSDDRIFYVGRDAVPAGIIRNSFWPASMDVERFDTWLTERRITHVAVAKARCRWGDLPRACETLRARGRLGLVFRDADGTLYRVEPPRPGR